MSKFLKSNLVGEYGELGDATLIPPKSEGGGPAEVTPASIVAATGQMTEEQAAQTRENIGAADAVAGIPDNVKAAIINAFAGVQWSNDNGSVLLDTLRDAMYPKASIVSISAVFAPGDAEIVYSQSLNSLRVYLTVYANYENGVSAPVSEYELSGTLAVGTSTITVSYEEFTTTFTVNVVVAPDEWENDIVTVTFENKTVSNGAPNYGTPNTIRGGYTEFAIQTSADYDYTIELITDIASVTEINYYVLDAAAVGGVTRQENISFAYNSGYSASPVVCTNAQDGGAIWLLTKSGVAFDAKKVQARVTRRYK